MAVIGTVETTPTVSLTLDLGTLAKRIASILGRSDIDAEIKNWINFTQREASQKVKFPELRKGSPQIITLIAGTYSYALETDFAQIDRALWKNNTVEASATSISGLEPLPRHFLDGAGLESRMDAPSGFQTQGDPRYYLINNNTILFYPVPNAAGVVKVNYYFLPADMTLDSHLPQISNQYRHYLIDLAYYWGQKFLEKDDITKVAYWKSRYDETMNLLKTLVEQQENKSQRMLLPETGMELADMIY